jgi:hypothetical protein
MVLLDEEVLIAAQLLGLDNLSEYVRDSLSYFISETGEELTKSQIREIAKKYAIMKRSAILQQQRITGRTEEEIREIERIKVKRFASIIESVKAEVDRIGPERFRKYLDDPFGDYTAIQDNIIAAVSQSSGYRVDLADVIQAFKAVRA